MDMTGDSWILYVLKIELMRLANELKARWEKESYKEWLQGILSEQLKNGLNNCDEKTWRVQIWGRDSILDSVWGEILTLHSVISI